MGQISEESARYILSLIGLAARAGSLTAGIAAVREEVRTGAVEVVLLGSDAAEGQKKKLVPLLRARDVTFSEQFSRAELGSAIGRPPVSAVGIPGGSFSRQLRETLTGTRGFRKIDDRRKLD